MHAIDTCVSRFTTVFYGTRIIVTPDLVSKVLHVPRVDCSDYPSHPHLIPSLVMSLPQFIFRCI